MNLSLSIFQWSPNVRCTGSLFLSRSSSSTDGTFSSAELYPELRIYCMITWWNENCLWRGFLGAGQQLWQHFQLISPISDSHWHKSSFWQSRLYPLRIHLPCLLLSFLAQGWNNLETMSRQTNGPPFDGQLAVGSSLPSATGGIWKYHSHRALRIWGNIHWISADNATCSSRNLISTPMIELVKSGPVRS